MRSVTVGIVSIGDMGLGMAKLLKAHGYRVVTVGEGRRYVHINNASRFWKNWRSNLWKEVYQRLEILGY